MTKNLPKLFLYGIKGSNKLSINKLNYMKRFLLIAKEDKASPFAVDGAIRLTSKDENGNIVDTLDVIYVNTSDMSGIGQYLAQKRRRVLSGHATVQNEKFKDEVCRIANLANKPGHQCNISPEELKFVNEQLRLFGFAGKVKRERCLVLA